MPTKKALTTCWVGNPLKKTAEWVRHRCSVDRARQDLLGHRVGNARRFENRNAAAHARRRRQASRSTRPMPSATARKSRPKSATAKPTSAFGRIRRIRSSGNFKVTKPGKFTVTAEIAGPEDSNLQVNFESKTSDANSVSEASASISSTVSKTGDYAKFETVKLGEIEIPAGNKAALTIKPAAEGWHPINLRSITLTPAK